MNILPNGKFAPQASGLPSCGNGLAIGLLAANGHGKKDCVEILPLAADPCSHPGKSWTLGSGRVVVVARADATKSLFQVAITSQNAPLHGVQIAYSGMAIEYQFLDQGTLGRQSGCVLLTLQGSGGGLLQVPFATGTGNYGSGVDVDVAMSHPPPVTTRFYWIHGGSWTGVELGRLQSTASPSPVTVANPQRFHLNVGSTSDASGAHLSVDLESLYPARTALAMKVPGQGPMALAPVQAGPDVEVALKWIKDAWGLEVWDGRIYQPGPFDAVLDLAGTHVQLEDLELVEGLRVQTDRRVSCGLTPKRAGYDLCINATVARGSVNIAAADGAIRVEGIEGEVGIGIGQDVIHGVMPHGATIAVDGHDQIRRLRAHGVTEILLDVGGGFEGSVVSGTFQEADGVQNLDLLVVPPTTVHEPSCIDNAAGWQGVDQTGFCIQAKGMTGIQKRSGLDVAATFVDSDFSTIDSYVFIDGTVVETVGRKISSVRVEKPADDIDFAFTDIKLRVHGRLDLRLHESWGITFALHVNHENHPDKYYVELNGRKSWFHWPAEERKFIAPLVCIEDFRTLRLVIGILDDSGMAMPGGARDCRHSDIDGDPR